ncbi:MAG TPA: YggS family pyridoxal phosphate-dependent enzyme [Blastocatellia bacterium]|nr:YggS family pyridoxal phosphate-dependent enzyme [Blastocatellia bacterium]
MTDSVQENISSIRERMAAAAKRVGRDPAGVRLIAVSKTVPVEGIIPALNAGITDLGENRVQEAETKIGRATAAGLRWHLIGPLQSNKARRAVELFDMIHSVDSIKLAERLNRIGGELKRVMPILIQVDLGKEATKSGIDEDELPMLVETISGCDYLRLDGLMTLPPYFENPEEARPYFRRLRQLLEETNKIGKARRMLTELSMGMSHDFEVAIEEGATMVRVGTAIFGSRNYPA